MKSTRPLFLLLSACFVGALENTPAENPPMILILIDGFRWDYLQLHTDETFLGFDRFVKEGVRAEYLNPVFPANSYPNWRTIVTGLYPESHGIVSNYMFDNQRDAIFTLKDLESTKDPLWWVDAEPLWITATKAQMDTALFLWSSCDVPWEGKVMPKYCTPYEYVSDEPPLLVKNVEKGLNMINDEGYKLIMLYVEVIDKAGHRHGPDSSEVQSAIKEIDLVMQELWTKMEDKDMLNTTNVVVVSDHGMAKASQEDLVFLDITPCLDSAQVVYVIERGGYMNILPATGFTDQVEESLKQCPGFSENVRVVRKENLEERYHYKAHRLIYEIVVIPHTGFILQPPDASYALPSTGISLSPGQHGFDNTAGEVPDMRGILFATGPSFLSGYQTGPVDQVDVYGLVCRALQLTPLPNNGTTTHIDPFFEEDTTSSSTSLVASCLLATSLLVLSVSQFLSAYQ